MMGPANIKPFILILFCSFSFLWSCYSSNLGGEPGDGEVDAPGEETVQSDVSDGRSDDPPAETLPEPCTGSDRLNLRYVDLDGNPMPDLAVAVGCLDHQYEGETDGDGRVVFDNLDLVSYPVTVTCVGENFAYTLTDIGGPRTIPDPLQIPLRVLSFLSSEDSRAMQGDIVRTAPGSEVLVSSYWYYDISDEERYDLWAAPLGSDLPMSVFEYTLEGDVATPVGYAFLRYDSPPEGADGPDAAPQSAEFQRASVRVEYDIGESSPFHVLDWSMARVQDGVMMRSYDPAENSWLAGIMTSWSSGASYDTAEFAWTEEALGEAVRLDAYVSASAVDVDGPFFSYYAAAELPDNPADWTSVTLHDPPEIISPADIYPLPFDEEILMRIPARVDLVRYAVFNVFTAYSAAWSIETPSDRTAITFEALPWPSSISRQTFLLGGGDELPRVMLGGDAYDADPFDRYSFWVDPAWGASHYVSSAQATMIELESPKD